jgi:hypothetical protein
MWRNRDGRRYSESDCCLLQTTTTTATIRYGTGAVALDLIYDTVGMGGISITKQGLGVATALTSDFNYVSCDGLVVRPLALITRFLPGSVHSRGICIQ